MQRLARHSWTFSLSKFHGISQKTISNGDLNFARFKLQYLRKHSQGRESCWLSRAVDFFPRGHNLFNSRSVFIIEKNPITITIEYLRKKLFSHTQKKLKENFLFCFTFCVSSKKAAREWFIFHSSLTVEYARLGSESEIYYRFKEREIDLGCIFV